jgi:hypothetical protein
MMAWAIVFAIVFLVALGAMAWLLGVILSGALILPA